MIYLLGLLSLLTGVALFKREAIADEITTRQDAFTRFDDLFKRYGKMRNVPWRWLKAIAWIESDLGREASVQAGMRSPGSELGWSQDRKSRGLMQLTLATANRKRVRPGTTISDLDNPEMSVDLASRYVRELMVYYFPSDREGIIRGYNGGPGWKNSSAKARIMTETYYARFKQKLSAVLKAQPGDEMERG